MDGGNMFGGPNFGGQPPVEGPWNAASPDGEDGELPSIEEYLVSRGADDVHGILVIRLHFFARDTRQ